MSLTTIIHALRLLFDDLVVVIVAVAVVVVVAVDFDVVTGGNGSDLLLFLLSS